MHLKGNITPEIISGVQHVRQFGLLDCDGNTGRIHSLTGKLKELMI